MAGDRIAGPVIRHPGAPATSLPRTIAGALRTTPVAAGTSHCRIASRPASAGHAVIQSTAVRSWGLDFADSGSSLPAARPERRQRTRRCREWVVGRVMAAWLRRLLKRLRVAVHPKPWRSVTSLDDTSCPEGVEAHGDRRRADSQSASGDFGKVWRRGIIYLMAGSGINPKRLLRRSPEMQMPRSISQPIGGHGYSNVLTSGCPKWRRLQVSPGAYPKPPRRCIGSCRSVSCQSGF